MTGVIDPDRNPYPPADFERRLSSIEGWRGTVDEWRRSVDSWRQLIDREGMATAVAVMGTRLETLQRDQKTTAEEVGEVRKIVESLNDDRQRRRGVVLTGRAIAGILAGLVSLATIIVLLVALLAGGGS